MDPVVVADQQIVGIGLQLFGQLGRAEQDASTEP